MTILKALTQKLFGTSVEPQDIKRIETADLHSPTGLPHYYYAKREEDGFFRIAHIARVHHSGGPINSVVGYDDVPYTLNESIDLLSRFEQTQGLYAGLQKTNRRFVESSRPEYFKAKLQDHYQRSEIETEMFGEAPEQIMKFKKSSLEETRNVMSRMGAQEAPLKMGGR